MPSKLRLEVQEHDLSLIEYSFHGDLTLSYIDVFVQDPKTQGYILRKFRVKGLLGNNANDISMHVRVIPEKIPGFEDISFPEESIDGVMATMYGFQRQEAKSYDETIQQRRAALGIARYIGNKDFSLEQIVGMIGVLYDRERKNYFRQQEMLVVTR